MINHKPNNLSKQIEKRIIMSKLLKWFLRAGIFACFAIGLFLVIRFLFHNQKDKDVKEDLLDNEKIVNLKAITIGTQPKGGMDAIYEKLDALTIPELGCTIRFDFIPWGDERKQINIATASGEYDIIPGGVFSDYRTLMFKNAYINLNNYFHLVPDLVSHYGIENLKKMETKGKIYGLPQLSEVGIKNAGEGFFYREDLRKQWGLRPIVDLSTMEAYLYRAKQEDEYKDEPLITDNRIWMSLWLLITKGKYLEVASAMETPFIVVEADNPTEPISRIETKEFKEVLSYIDRWYRDGIIASDMLAASDNEGTKGLNLMLANKKPSETNVPIWACSNNYIPELYEANPEWEFGFFDYTIHSSRLYLGTMATNSVLSISSKSSSPEIAIKLLEKLHTDTRYYFLLCYGVEGIHYEFSDGILSYDTIPIENRYAGWTAAGDATLDYKAVSVNPKWQKDVIEKREEIVKENLEIAEDYYLDGFIFEKADILNEVNTLEIVKKEFFQPLVCGVVGDYESEILNLSNELEAAGFDKYLKQLKMQLNQFAANKME